MNNATTISMTQYWGIGTHDIASALEDGKPLTRLEWAGGAVEYLPEAPQDNAGWVAEMTDLPFTVRMANRAEVLAWLASQVEEGDEDAYLAADELADNRANRFA